MLTKTFFILLIFLNVLITFGQQNNQRLQTVMNTGSQMKGELLWSVAQRPLLCICSSRGDSTILSFYREGAIIDSEVFHYNTSADLVGIFQSGGGKGNLIALWMAGSAYTVTVFSYAQGNVNLVLKKGSKILPELRFPTFDSLEYDILITQMDWVAEKNDEESVFKPTYTIIYRWKRDHYDTLRMGWEHRFASQTKQEIRTK